MSAFAFALGIAFLLMVLLDAFQTIILPRRPVGRLRLTRLFFLATWAPWYTWMKALPVRGGRRDQGYSMYGPLSLLLLFVVWALSLTTAFALMYFGLHAPFVGLLRPVGPWQTFRECFYASGTTLFTLGLGDVLPASHASRALVVFEAGTGLGFMALVIGYVPVLYAAFSQRELTVALLDARAGSPPTAAELMMRHNYTGGHHALTALLAEWERWCAELLETHVSYPILCYYRSQHDNQSWLAALCCILDTCALLITAIEGPSTRQAQLTFAIGRHALVDLGHVFHREAEERRLREAAPQRLQRDEYNRLCAALRTTGYQLCGDLEANERLTALRRMYEPHACALANYLKLELPVWAPLPRDPKRTDVWSAVSDLRVPESLAERLSAHVSQESTAAHLEHDASSGS